MYRIKGADQKEYGPITAEQLRQWITENRLNRNSLASTDDNPGWRPLGQFPEFADVLGSQAPSIAAADPVASASQPPQATYAPATVGAAIPTGSREAALNLVSGPAISLIVLGGLGTLISLISIPIGIMQAKNGMPMPPNVPPEMQQYVQMWMDFAKSYGTFANILSALLNGLVLFGGIKMKSLESPALCWAAAVIALVPCFNPCCCIWLPFGIWAIVTLNKPDVKAHLR